MKHKIPSAIQLSLFLILAAGVKGEQEIRLLEWKGTPSAPIKFSFERKSAATTLSPDGRILDIGPNVPRFEERTDADGLRKIGYLSEGPATNHFLHSSFEKSTGQWKVSEGLKLELDAETAIHGKQSIRLSGKGRLMQPPVKMPAGNVSPFLSWFVSAYVRRVDDTPITKQDIVPVAARSADGASGIENKPGHFFIEQVGQSPWYRVIGYFVPPMEGQLWHCGFQVNREVWIDAVQLERRWSGSEAVAPTSYVPTFDALATRRADQMALTTKQFKWPQQEGTLSLWTRTRSLHHNGDGTVLAQGFEDAGEIFHVILRQFGGGIGAGMPSGGTRTIKSVPTNHWTWIAVTWRDGRGWLFVDGKLNQQQMSDGFSTKGIIGKPAGGLLVGVNPNTSFHLAGFAADIRILDRALNPNEIWNRYREEYKAAGGKPETLKPPPELAVQSNTAGVPRDQWIELRFELPHKGRTSINIYDETGRIVRSLWSGVVAGAGSTTAEWDTLNDQGMPVLAGNYSFSVLQADKVRARFVATVGNGRVPQRAGDLGGVHALTPFGVQVDELGNVYVLGSGHGIAMQKFDSDGNLLWTHSSRDSNDMPTALALAGKHLFLAGQHLWRIDRETGKVAEMQDGSWRAWLGDPPEVAPLPENPYENVEEYWIQRKLLNKVRVRGIAVNEVRVYVSLFHDNRIDIFNAVTLKKTGTIGGIQKPAGLAVDNAGQLLAVSGNQVLQFSPDGKQRSLVIGKGLTHPWALAAAKTGDIFVTDLGRPNQLKQFSSGGTLKAVLGEPGSLEGSIRLRRLYAPVGVALGPRGEILIAENLLNRIQSLRLADNFKTQWALYGGAYFESSSFNSAAPEQLYGLDGMGQGTLFEYQLDFETGNWQPVRFWWLGHQHPTREVKGYLVHGMQVHELAGRRFIFASHKTVRIYRQDGDRLQSVARIGGRFRYLDSNGKLQRPKGPYPIWIDLNGDELAQENEVSYRPDKKWKILPHISYSSDVETTPDGTVYWGNFSLPLEKIDESGVPHYRWESARVVGPDFAKMRIKEGVTLDKERNRYFHLLWYDHSYQQPGLGHWARHVVKCFIQKYSKDSRLLWQTGRKANQKVKPGEMYHPTGVEFAGGNLFVSDEPGIVHIYDPDGLYVATLLNDMTDGSHYRAALSTGVLPKMSITIGEFWQMRVVQHPKTKKIYIIGQSHEFGEHLKVFEILGLDEIYRTRGTTRIAKQAVLPAKQKNTEESSARQQKQPKHNASIWLAKKPLAVRADLAGWPALSGERVEDPREKIKGFLRCFFDSDFIYASVEIVGDESPAANANAEVVGQAWNGDCLEFFVCSDPKANSGRSKYTASDFQFVIPAERTSKLNRVYCQNLGRFVPGSQSALGVDEAGNRWRLALKIPWKFMGKYRPRIGDVIKWNFLISFGDPSGGKRLIGLNWSGHGRSWTDVRHWGQAEFKYVD